MLPLFRSISIGVRCFCRMPEKSAIVILAEGAEEMETVVPIDILRRADIKVTLAGLAGTDSVKCARGTRIVPDDSLSNVENQSFDCVILPGGAAGSEALAKADSVGRLLKSQNEAKKLIAAICAAPIALKSHGIPASQVTSHFSVRDKLEKEGGYKYSEERVVVADNIITSQGPGTSVEFSLKIVELLQGKEKADSLIKPMILKL